MRCTFYFLNHRMYFSYRARLLHRLATLSHCTYRPNTHSNYPHHIPCKQNAWRIPQKRWLTASFIIFLNSLLQWSLWESFTLYVDRTAWVERSQREGRLSRAPRIDQWIRSCRCQSNFLLLVRWIGTFWPRSLPQVCQLGIQATSIKSGKSIACVADPKQGLIAADLFCL